MDLDGYRTFKIIDKILSIKIVPTKQVFIYKIDTNRYLIKFKA